MSYVYMQRKNRSRRKRGGSKYSPGCFLIKVIFIICLGLFGLATGSPWPVAGYIGAFFLFLLAVAWVWARASKGGRVF